MIIFDKQAFRADYLAERGITEEDYSLLNIVERERLDTAIEAERQALIRDWEGDLGEDW